MPRSYRNGDTIVEGVEGYYVETYRCRYDKETNTLQTRVYETSSIYDARDAVIARITTPETTEPPNIIIGGGVPRGPRRLKISPLVGKELPIGGVLRVLGKVARRAG